MTAEEHLADLQRRFQLIEGEREATYETAKLAIQHNKEIINQMKEENKTLRTQLTQIHSDKPQSTEKQFEKTDSSVQMYQRKYNVLKADNARKRSQVDQLDLRLSEYSLGSQIYTSKASPEMRQIRVLEHRFEKTMLKYGEAQTIRKTYEAIVKKLQEERIKVCNQLEHMLKGKEREYENYVLTSHDAYSAKEMAQAELHRFEQGVMEERKQRDKNVQEKKELVEQRIQMNKRLEMRRKIFTQRGFEKKNGFQSTNIFLTSDPAAGVSSEYAHEDQQKLQTCAEALGALKEATGVSNVDDIIQKLFSQKDTQKNLAELTKRNHAKLDHLVEQCQRLKLRVEELKFSSGVNVSRRDAIDNIDHRIDVATEKFDRNKDRFEGMAKISIHMKAGINHLCQNLLPIKLDGERPTDMSGKTIEQALQHCDLKISKLLSLTQHLYDPIHCKIQLNEKKYEEKLLLQSQLNTRVKITDKEEVIESDDEDC